MFPSHTRSDGVQEEGLDEGDPFLDCCTFYDDHLDDPCRLVLEDHDTCASKPSLVPSLSLDSLHNLGPNRAANPPPMPSQRLSPLGQMAPAPSPASTHRRGCSW